MLTASGLASTLCCRGPKIEVAFQAILTASVSDKDLFKQNWENLVTKERTLLASRDKLLAGGQGPRLASTPTPSLVSRFRQRIILHATQRPQRNTCQPRPSAV